MTSRLLSAQWKTWSTSGSSTGRRVAPVLKKVVASQTLPEGTDLDVLLHLVALNGARPPGAMTLLRDKVDEIMRQQLVNRITPEAHKRIVRQWKAEGRGTEHIEDLETLKARIRGGSVRIEFPRDYFLVAGVLGKTSVLVDLLGKRFWTLLVAAAGAEFICSDRPVSLLNIVNVSTDTEPRYTDGRFDVIMPLSRSLCLVGHAYGQDGVTAASRRTVGFINHITSAGASDYVYSASEERQVSEEVAFEIENGNAYRDDVLVCRG